MSAVTMSWMPGMCGQEDRALALREIDQAEKWHETLRLCGVDMRFYFAESIGHLADGRQFHSSKGATKEDLRRARNDVLNGYMPKFTGA